MKHIIFFFLFFAGICYSEPALSQNKKVVTTRFWVAGVCEMCKERIERSVDVKGVKSAEYDLNEHFLTISYNPKQVSLDELHDLLNAAGHDTSRSVATDEAYEKVHNCCRYREHKHNH